jgi:hypothetical protein
MSFEGTILDVYEVSYAGLERPLLLYIDEYAFESLYAPVGFTYNTDFPLVEP